jgi:hypothetical protein
VIETHPDEAERLATRLSAWREKVPLYRRDEGEQAPALDAATIDALQALGYVGGRE